MNDTNNEKQTEDIKNEQQVTQGFLLHAIYGMIKEMKQTNKITISKRGLRSLILFGIVAVCINSYAFVSIFSEKHCNHNDVVAKLAIAEHERDEAINAQAKKDRKIKRLENDKWALLAAYLDQPQRFSANKFQPNFVTKPVKKVILENIDKSPKIKATFQEMYLNHSYCTVE